MTLVNQTSQKSVWFALIDILKTLVIILNDVCNKCHNLSIMADELENIAILNVKGVNYGCALWNITRYDTINRLNNAKFDDKGTLDFGANKTAVVVIKEGVFGGTYFRGIFSGDNGK